MLVKTLIDKAKEKSQIPLGKLAEDMGIAQSHISCWKRGDYLPSPAQTAFLANLAGIDPIIAIAEIEAEKKPAAAKLWQAAGINIGGNGGIRTLDAALHRILP